MVRKIGPSSFTIVVVADCGGSIVRCGWLVEIALAAMPHLHGDWQVFALCDHDLRSSDGARWLLECDRSMVGPDLMTTI